MRNLTKALTVVSLLAPVSGYSLGIGDIRVRSALNQNLNAEIKLNVSPNENADSIKVNLAPPERFDSAGVAWSYFLSKIRFKTIVKPNGSVVVKVTSTEALKEPYLNFLLEVSWPKGNLYREFTVLVDPPAEYQDPSYQVVPRNEPSYYPQEEVYAQPSRPRLPAKRPVRQRYRPNPAGHFGGQVVARRNDTLWRVAARARGGSDVSVEQMMMALFAKNPHAFFQPNVNALSAGKTLQVPEKSVVQQTSRQQALNEFSQHNVAWQNHTLVPAAEETQVAKEVTVDNQLKLVAPTESTVSATETVAPTSEQAATKPPSTGTASGIGQQDSTEKGAKEGNPVIDQALQSKVDALQKKLETMEQLIDLKDKQLADLQNTGKTSPEGKPVPPIQPLPPTEIKPVEEIKPTPTEQVPPVEVVTATPPRPGEPIETVKPIEPPRQPVVNPVVKPAPALRQESDSSYLGIIGAMVLTLLSLLGWMWWRKQKLIEETDAESMFGNYSMMRTNEMIEQPGTAPSKKAAAAAAGGALTEESSFLNDFKASDFESFESFNVDHGDIDPVAEADVYLAYGRYQQAEDLMVQAIKDSPDRDECKLKLLEIYQVSQNKDAFEALATELSNAGKRSDRDFWDKVVELSKDVSDDNELFSTTSSPAVFEEKSDLTAESIFLSPTEGLDEDIKPLEDEEYLGESSFNTSEDDGTETSFDSIYSQPETSPKEVETQPELKAGQSEKVASTFDTDEKMQASFQNNGSMDFDLGPYPGSSQKQPREVNTDNSASSVESGLKQSKTIDTLAQQEMESYDFDFDIDKIDVNKPIESMQAKPADSWDPDQTIDFSFDEKPTPKAAPENPSLDFSFDLDGESIKSAKSESFGQKESLGVSDLTDMDEMETKLDLAKAYIDMGDAESAKEIISQVIKHGSVEQKKTAELLLKEFD